MIFLGDKRSISLKLTTVFTIAIFAACNSNQDKLIVKEQVAAPAKSVLTQPFRYHKVIEVSPGNSFDIFSWGRGSAETGSFLILQSDSAEAKYTTTTGDLDGTITDVYNTDMDMDGNPEILIQAKSKDSAIYTQIYAFEYKNNKAEKLTFPKLTSSQKKGYRGQDNFYIKEGVLMREFPIFDGNDAEAKPTAEKRILTYGIYSNNFTVKTADEEDKSQKQAPAKTDTVKKSSAVAPASINTSTKNTSQKKHHAVESHHHRTSHHTTKKSSHKSSSKSRKSSHRRHHR